MAIGPYESKETGETAWLRGMLETFDKNDVVVFDRYSGSFLMRAYITAHDVADRPGRIEPRVLKRRRERYPLMLRPREQLRAELGKT